MKPVQQDRKLGTRVGQTEKEWHSSGWEAVSRQVLL